MPSGAKKYPWGDRNGGRLLVIERIPDDDPAKGDPIDFLIDLHFMLNSGASLRSVSEHQKLLLAAGFRPKRVLPTALSARVTAEMIAGGTSSPSGFAFLRLMTKSILVGCSTGMSAGFAPRSILSTKSPARRNRSEVFAP
jgi:hypothetical protein